jgi:hypothetical protein
VFRVTFPRGDLDVHIGSVRLDPALALTSWVAFLGTGPHSMMMGDLVLLDSETEPVMTKLVEGGLEVTALHNHLLHETPQVMFLHIAGEGDPAGLAETVKRALSVTGTPPAKPAPAAGAPNPRLAAVEAVLGRRGHQVGDVLQFSIPRSDVIMVNGVPLPPAMGVAHGINFQVTASGVATTGDFVLLADEVNPVVRALTQSGIAVTAVHNHMLDESPRVFFLHFWGVGQPETIARGVKQALAQTRATGP